MPCGSCGKTGHNTRKCPLRQTAEWGAGQAASYKVSSVVGGAAAAHGAPGGGILIGHASGYLADRVARAVVHEQMMTKSQIRYRKQQVKLHGGEDPCLGCSIQ